MLRNQVSLKKNLSSTNFISLVNVFFAPKNDGSSVELLMNIGVLENLPSPTLGESSMSTCLPATVLLTLDLMRATSPSRTPLTNSQVKDDIA